MIDWYHSNSLLALPILAVVMQDYGLPLVTILMTGCTCMQVYIKSPLLYIYIFTHCSHYCMDIVSTGFPLKCEKP